MSGNDQPNKVKFLSVFILTMGLLGGIRHLFDIKIPSYDDKMKAQISSRLLPTEEPVVVTDSASSVVEEADSVSVVSEEPAEVAAAVEAVKIDADSVDVSVSDGPIVSDITEPDSVNKNTALYHISGKIWSYDECLPDTQEQHLTAAMKNGVRPLADKASIERLARNHQLVNISHSPLYAVDRLTHSSPYLVPRARDLLNTISINFMDSLRSKGYPVYLPIVSSVLRTTSDVDKLRNRNLNATENSCHNYGTTFDITYSRYMPLTGIPTPVDSAEWRSSELKLTLAEVLYDLRLSGRCYVKHEHKQPCFHITVR